MGAPPELLESITNLDLEVQKAFEGLRNQIQGLQQLARGLEEHNEEGDTEVWQLSHEDAALLGEESPLTPEALILQRSVRSHEHGIHGPSQLRLNSHMMELSMKASEAVDALGHSNWKPSVLNGLARHSVYSMANASQSASGIVLPGCGRVKAVPPDSKFRIAWDLFGMMLMVCDAFVLPVCMAWDLNITPFPQTYWERGMLQVFAIVSLAFWPLDIALNFFTGFHVKGHYNYALWAIAKRYMMTWFAFDLSVVTIDYGAAFTITGTEDDAAGFLQPLRSARYLRVLRMVRILRILKAGKVNVMLENLVIAMGRQWLILAFTVGKMLMAIGLVTHILTCLWFWLGKLVHEEGIRKSWLDLANVTELDLGLQYAHSASWILLPPSPPTLEPDSRVERLASLMCFVTTVLVIGSALSILTGTLNEIRQVNNERSKKRRELRIFLQTRRVPTELLMRVMSYADYKIARHSPVSYDSSLISPMLEAELAIVNFGNILTEHPVFNMVRTLFPNIFADLCNSLEKRYFCEMEYVFHAGTLVEMMYITSHGTFSLMKDKKASKVNTFTDERHYFGEVALYVEAALHPFALQTASFAEVFVLSVSRLTNVLVNSPLCATMFVEYATDFIGRYKVPMQPTWEEVDDLVRLQEECARESCANNSFALPINLDSRKYLAHLDLRYIQADPTCSTQAALETLEDSEMDPARTVLKEFIAEVVHSEEASAAETLLKLREAYVELDGLHARFSEPMEQERAESGILSLIALVRRDYEMFVTPQKADMALSRAQWDALQDILEWAQPNPDKLAGAMFLVAIKGLGKFRSLTGQMPREDQRPEKALLYLLRFHPHAVPSLNEMSEEAQEFVIGILELQQSFNFAQMLQAENVPANLAKLQAQIRERQGIDLLKFYVLFLLAFMSGLAGGRGSRFMTNRNATSVLIGLSMMRNILEDEPAPLYWGYLRQRSLQWSPGSGSAHLALARLACLARAQSYQDYLRIQDAWNRLQKAQQLELTRNLLADGIVTKAMMCEYLPQCLENARSNPFVTLSAFLEVLVDLLQAVRAVAEGSCMVVNVDLMDLSSFVLMVQNAYVFQSCLLRAKLRVDHTASCRFFLDMTQENWRRINEPPNDTVVAAHGLRGLLRRQEQNDASDQRRGARSVVRCHV